MVNLRVSRLSAEVLAQPDSELMVSRLSADVLVKPESELQVSRLSAEVLVSVTSTHFLEGESNAVTTVVGFLIGGPHELEGSADAVTTVTADLTNAGPLIISAAGRGFIFLASLDNGFSELTASIFGFGTVTGSITTPSNPVYSPVNYPLGIDNDDVVELAALLDQPDNIMVSPRAEVQGTLELVLSGTSTGTSDTDGDVGQTNPFSAEVYGEGFVIGELFVSGVGAVAELAAEVYGEGFVITLGTITGTWTLEQTGRAYYIYGNVGTGFYPIDAIDDAVSQTFTDGDIVQDFARYLYQLVNVGVGFDYTDDASDDPGFVSQSYPDGDIIRDFARYLYQYVNVTTGIFAPLGRVTVGPAPRRPEDLTPTARPPRILP